MTPWTWKRGIESQAILVRPPSDVQLEWLGGVGRIPGWCAHEGFLLSVGLLLRLTTSSG